MALGCPTGQKLGIHWPDIERPWPFASPGKEFPDALLSSFPPWLSCSPDCESVLPMVLTSIEKLVAQTSTGAYEIGADHWGGDGFKYAGWRHVRVRYDGQRQRQVHRGRCCGRNRNGRLGDHGEGGHHCIQHIQNNG